MPTTLTIEAGDERTIESGETDGAETVALGGQLNVGGTLDTAPRARLDAIGTAVAQGRASVIIVLPYNRSDTLGPKWNEDDELTLNAE